MGMDDFWHGWTHPECQAAIAVSDDEGEGFEMHAHTRGRRDDESLPPEFSSDYRGVARI